LELQDLELIGFGLGPGRFSGLRVAAAATQANPTPIEYQFAVFQASQ